MGYVPLFDSLTTGTLHGKWPDIGLWPVLLSLADRYGNLDVTPQYVSGVTGLAVDAVIACINRFCSPDPDSRSTEGDGRRLEPIDPARKWGWHVVNHAKYREKARLLARDSERTASGMDAARKRRERQANGIQSASPPLSPEFPPSDGDGDKDEDGDKREPPLPPVGGTDQVFVHWQVVHNHPKAVLDKPRRRTIERALKHYSVDTLCEAISGYCNSPHHMGQNKDGTVYDDVSLMLRNSTHIEAGLRFARVPPTPENEAQRRQAANLQTATEWVAQGDDHAEH